MTTYPSGGIETQSKIKTMLNMGSMTLNEWRRSNVDRMVKQFMMRLRNLITRSSQSKSLLALVQQQFGLQVALMRVRAICRGNGCPRCQLQ